jgi:hypothetical protein
MEEATVDEMLRVIHAVWNNPATPEALLEVIYALQDGYGEAGFIPTQGYDWSGIRDSSGEAIRAIYAAIHA